jgi:FkbM family methyltransferase
MHNMLVLIKTRIFIVKITNLVLRIFGYSVAKTKELVHLRSLNLKDSERQLQFLTMLEPKHAGAVLELFSASKSQLQQDLLVIALNGFKQNGYFVEFGATNGVDLSNTWLLANRFGWRGILGEPAKVWHQDLALNRPESIIEHLCIWKDSGSTLDFNEASSAELSTISSYSFSDLHSEARSNGKNYPVLTISINDLLSKHHAPEFIDYLSIDTEGSEFEILSSLDFSRYSFGVITCEHNFSDRRDEIYQLLKKNGYTRIMESVSMFDDWFIGPRIKQMGLLRDNSFGK